MSEACGENTRGANQRTARQFRAFVAKRQWQHMAMGSTRRWVGAGFTGGYPLLTSTLCSKADMKRCLGLVSSSISGYSTWFEPRPASQSVSQCEATKGEHRAGHRLVRGSVPHGSSIFCRASVERDTWRLFNSHLEQQRSLLRPLVKLLGYAVARSPDFDCVGKSPASQVRTVSHSSNLASGATRGKPPVPPVFFTAALF